MNYSSTISFACVLAVLLAAATACDKPKTAITSSNKGASDTAASGSAGSGGEVKTESEDEKKHTAELEAEAKSLKEGGTWEEERVPFYARWAQHNPEQAIIHARANNDTNAAIGCVARILSEWVNSGREEALEWLSKQEPTPERGVWLASTVNSWPQENLSELEGTLADWSAAPGGLVAIRAYANRMVKDQPDQFFAWVETKFKDSPQAGEVIKRITSDWAQLDPEAASGWLTKADSNAFWRDDAIEGLALSVVNEDPEAARTWINSIQDEKRREEALARLNSPR